MTMRPLFRVLLAALATAVLVAVLSSIVTPFRDYQIAEIAVEATAVAGLTVLTGLSGQISLGNGAFMAIGAYTTALLLLHLSWPFIAVLVISAVVTAAAGAIVGIAAARLHGPYLAGATLMLGVALPALADAYPAIFGGDQGLNVVYAAPGFLGVNFPLTRWQAWVSSAVALVTLALLANLAHSRVGRNWRAVRDDEVAAALAGVNVARTRVLAFVVSAGCAGLAGALLAIITGLVAPGAFTITLSIAMLTAAVIGGLGTLPGAVWGSLVIVLVPTYATDLATSRGLSTSVASNIPIVAYGVVLILVMLMFPRGIQGGVSRLLGLFRRPRVVAWRTAPAPDAGPPADQAPASNHEVLLAGGDPRNAPRRKVLNEEIEPASRPCGRRRDGGSAHPRRVQLRRWLELEPGNWRGRQLNHGPDRVRARHHRDHDHHRQPPAAYRAGGARLQRDRSRGGRLLRLRQRQRRGLRAQDRVQVP
jgi:branched-chain amino acid transport system permease protein